MEMADKRVKIGMEDEANENPSLPQEIILDILSRSPVKSLCKFRCVSKSWLSLISDPDFIDTHLDRALENDDRQRLLITSRVRDRLYSVNYESIHEENDDLVARMLDYPDRCKKSATMVDSDLWMPESPYLGMDLLGSCHGLVCIDMDGEYCLFNPATREYKQIPEIPDDNDYDDDNHSEGRGFGYDHENDDYKLVSVYGGICWVYSLRKGKWRKVEDFDGEFQNEHKAGFLLDDAIHWVVKYGPTELRIAGFELTDETFWELDMPARDSIQHGTEFSVGAINGCLCLLYSGNEEMQNHFWMKTEDGDEDVWTKFTISFSYRYMRPVCLSVSGESLLVVDGQLVLCDFEDDSVDFIHGFNIKNFPLKFICDAESYVESLISPHAFGHEGKWKCNENLSLTQEMETTGERGKIGVEDEASEYPNLPQEIILEILSRSPVKSLCKFRCVSKSWLSLISDPDFIDTHLDRALENDDRKRLLITSRVRDRLYSVNYESIHEENDDLVARMLDYPDRCTKSPTMVDSDLWMPELPYHGMDLLGSCHGLVCIDMDGEYCLFNPATREYKQIPEIPDDDDYDDDNYSEGRGFGYDHENDDYKLVSVYGGICWVYSLRRGKWRKVEDFDGEFQNEHKAGFLLDDAIHWVVKYGRTKLQIAGFELTEETFWELDMPARDSIQHGTEFSVGAINGCLCLLYSGNEEMRNHFWMLTENGDEDVWTKFTISFSYKYMRPVCLSVSGESLFVVDGKLILCDVEDDGVDFKHGFNIKNFPLRIICEVESYVESLISPHAFGQM